MLEGLKTADRNVELLARFGVLQRLGVQLPHNTQRFGSQRHIGPGDHRTHHGIPFARFTNGESRALAQIALANFNNPNGLQPIGDTNWVETFASGPSNVGAPGTSGLGVIQSAALEESNVEITAQLVDLIIAQRNFQANAQVIQAEDAVTQTVINLR